MPRWADCDTDSEHEMVTEVWKDQGSDDFWLDVSEAQPGSSSACSTTTSKRVSTDPKRRKTSSDSDEFEFVDAPETTVLKLKRKAPKEVEKQILARCNLEDREAMKDVMKKGLDGSLEQTDATGKSYVCRWCQEPGPKSMRLPVQYNTSEWRSAIFLLCFSCCQGTSPILAKENTPHADKFYNSQPSDANFETMRHSEDSMGGVWTLPDKELQEPSDDMRSVVEQRVIKPGTAKVHLDSGDEIDIEATAAMTSVQCCHKEPSRLPTINFVWDKVDKTTRNTITIRPFSNNFHEIPAANNGLAMVTKEDKFAQFTRMRPPNWDKNSQKWVYHPMFTDRDPLKDFKRTCKQANVEWEACQAMDYFTFRNERFKLSVKEAEAEADGRKLTFREKTDALRNSKLALGLLTVCPPLRRAVHEPSAAFKRRLLDHFEHIHKMCKLFERWEEDFKYRIDPLLQKDFAKRVYGSDRFLDYTSTR